MMEFFPIGELIDRYCIAKLKFERTGKNHLELSFYQDRMISVDVKKIEREIDELYTVHKEIWDLESLLKSGLEEHLPLEEIGERSIMIRNWNKKRIEIKNKIAEILQDPIREIKQDHISE